MDKDTANKYVALISECIKKRDYENLRVLRKRFLQLNTKK